MAGVQRPLEIMQMLMDKQMAGQGSLYFTTIQITLELYGRFAVTRRLPLRGFGNSLLLGQLRAEMPAPQNDQGLEDWEVDCEFHPSKVRHSLHINNGGESGEEWGLFFDPATALELSQQRRVVFYGLKFTIWVYVDDDSQLRGLAISMVFNLEELHYRPGRLLPPPQPITPSPDEAGSSGEGGQSSNA